MARFLSTFKGLRFRLTLSHSIFFALVLAAIGFGFREFLLIQHDGEIQVALEEGWVAAKAFLRIERGLPQWEDYPSDPQRQEAQLRLRSMHLLLESDGTALSVSGPYTNLPRPSAEDIQRVLASDNPETFRLTHPDGTPYMLRAGRIKGLTYGRYYYFAIGRSLEFNARTLDAFTTNYFGALPFLTTLTGLLGWWMAGRVLQPLNAVSQAADSISGANLSLQIPARGADDELDHMIHNFNRMTNRLQESFNQIRRFSTDASHELRTPLTSIRGQLEVAIMTAKTPAQYHEAVVRALEDAERLSSLVNVLLQLAQAEGGQVPLERERLRLAKLVSDVLDQFQPLADEKKQTVSSTIEPEVSLMADRLQLERLIANLVSNAIKYTPKGGSVTISAEVVNDVVCLRVQDTGVGIAPENLPHIFDRFYRVRGQQKTERGLGLGLSFVDVIAKAHGGRVEATSTAGEGTCFKVYLPGALATRPDHLRG